MSRFLQLAVSGTIEEVKRAYDSNQDVTYERDAEGRNALALAVLAGRWPMAMVLLKYCRVSPHAVDKHEETLYHLYVRGLKANLPKPEDFSEIRAENLNLWRNEEEKDRARIAEVQNKNPDIKPPEKLLIKKAEDNEREVFGKIELFFPYYLMNKYHAVLNKVNAAGASPADLAEELGELQLAGFYQECAKPHMVRRRLVQGLNENLVRDIASFL
jgi:hypothetical protein